MSSFISAAALGYLSPMAFEKKWLADRERLAA
jgi:hypothetical protein